MFKWVHIAEHAETSYDGGGGGSPDNRFGCVCTRFPLTVQGGALHAKFQSGEGKVMVNITQEGRGARVILVRQGCVFLRPFPTTGQQCVDFSSTSFHVLLSDVERACLRAGLRA